MLAYRTCTHRPHQRFYRARAHSPAAVSPRSIKLRWILLAYLPVLLTDRAWRHTAVIVQKLAYYMPVICSYTMLLTVHFIIKWRLFYHKMKMKITCLVENEDSRTEKPETSRCTTFRARSGENKPKYNKDSLLHLALGLNCVCILPGAGIRPS